MVDVEVAPWLKGVPVAPEYHPSEAEFADPITFILRIEEQVKQFGICKVVPPVAKQSRKSVVCNLGRCIAAAQGRSPKSHQDGNSLARVKFTTQRQRVGWNRDGTNNAASPARGGSYSVEQFEARSKEFARGKLGTNKEVPPLVLETLFWQSIEQDKCTFVESASGIPGSAFPENEKTEPAAKKRKKSGRDEEPSKLANGSWNMRNLSQLQGSLFRFMPKAVPGVTAPALFISMLYSWSAWHTDEHELHTLQYLHMGAPKTWYTVPPGAAATFEDVVRVHGYNDQVDPEGTVATPCERTTILSPEALVSNGVPCCRLVQNPGEYVVVLPRSYHLNFSHGFNSGETCNIATPGWLKIAKQAAARRVAVDHPPVFCHEQLLYQAAQAFSKSSIASDIRSSRLKHKMKLCVDEAIKTEFANDFIKNQQLLFKLGKMPQTRCIVLRESESEKENLCNLVNLGSIDSISLLSFVCESMEGLGGKDSSSCHKAPRMDWGALSCAVCGILCYSSVGIIQPTSEATKNILSNKNSKNFLKRSREGGNEVSALPASILCAEHALQVSVILQHLGGSRILIACHPEYQMFEISAKQIAKEMSIEFRPKDIRFEKGNEEDFQLIRTATAGDWVTRLPLTSQGTIKLSENEESEDSESDEENVVEKTLKEKKCWVVGRWCGRVWRYDQAHVLLGGCISPRASRKDDADQRKDGLVLDEERQQVVDELVSLTRNCRKRRRTQLVSVCKTGSEPQSECTTAVPPINLVSETSDKINSEALVIIAKGNKTRVKDEDTADELPHGTDREVVGDEIQETTVFANSAEVQSVHACKEESPSPHCKQEPENSRDLPGHIDKQNNEELAQPTCTSKKEPESKPVFDSECDGDVLEAPFCEETACEILTPDNKELHSSEREWCLHEDNSLPSADADPESTSNNSRWHEVAISFSPTLRATYMEKGNVGGRASSTKLQARRAQPELEETLEAETENEMLDEEPGLASDVSFSGEETFTSGDDESRQNEDETVSTRSRKAKRKSWRATVLDEEEERPAKSLKKCTGSSKKALSPARKTKNQKTIYVDVESTEAEEVHACDFDGCNMSFGTASDLALHKRNICTIKECGKRLCNHNYLMQHYRVHVDDRPLKCDWKGCKKTFKWSWARTEHMRVHTGARPYTCNQCGKNYRFVSDFSRHKRTTGHMLQELSATKPVPHKSWRSRG